MFLCYVCVIWGLKSLDVWEVQWLPYTDYIWCMATVAVCMRLCIVYPFNAHRKVGPCCNSSVLLPIISGHPITVCACSRVGTRRPGWVETWHDPVSLKTVRIM